MLIEDFIKEINHLETNYSKSVSSDKIDQLFQCFNNVPLWKIRKMTAHIVSTKERFGFTIAEFRFALKEITDVMQAIDYQCLKCKDTGKIFKGSEYVGRCDCVVKSEDIKALLVLINHPELLKPIQGKSYEEWRKYITRPEIVQVLMASEKAIIE